DRSLRIFPMQANGSEMLRLATALVCGAGIRVCATVHDALIVECRTEEVKEVVPKVQHLIARASEYVLPGFPLRSDVKVFSYPDRFSDKRGLAMWQTVCRLLDEEGGEEACSAVLG